MLNRTKLLSALPEDAPDLFLMEVTSSTNDDAKAYLAGRPDRPVLFAANRQTAGRGRLGRRFISPEGGLYMTLAFPTGVPVRELIGATSAAAVAAARAVRSVSGADCRIKWVNDLYLDGGKLAGILCESVNADETSRYLIIGIGINLENAPLMADSVVPASSLARYPHDPETLCAAVVRGLYGLRDTGFSFGPYAAEYRRLSLILGKPVSFTRNGVVREGVARDIDRNGALLVRCGCNDIRLDSGEITLRTGKETL